MVHNCTSHTSSWALQCHLTRAGRPTLQTHELSREILAGRSQRQRSLLQPTTAEPSELKLLTSLQELFTLRTNSLRIPTGPSSTKTQPTALEHTTSPRYTTEPSSIPQPFNPSHAISSQVTKEPTLSLQPTDTYGQQSPGPHRAVPRSTRVRPQRDRDSNASCLNETLADVSLPSTKLSRVIDATRDCVDARLGTKQALTSTKELNTWTVTTHPQRTHRQRRNLWANAVHT